MLGISCHLLRNIKYGYNNLKSQKFWFAKYLIEERQARDNNDVAEVAVYYKIKRRVETFDPLLLGESELTKYQPHCYGMATHFVKQVVYGAEIICSMKRSINRESGETKESVEESIYLAASDYFEKVITGPNSSAAHPPNNDPPAELNGVKITVFSSIEPSNVMDNLLQFSDYLRSIVNISGGQDGLIHTETQWRPVEMTLLHMFNVLLALDRQKDLEMEKEWNEATWKWIDKECCAMLLDQSPISDSIVRVPPLEKTLRNFRDLLGMLRNEMTKNSRGITRADEQPINPFSDLLAQMKKWLIDRRREIQTICQLFLGTHHLAMVDIDDDINKTGKLQQPENSMGNKNVKVFILKVDYVIEDVLMMESIQKLVGEPLEHVQRPVFPIISPEREQDLAEWKTKFIEFADRAGISSGGLNVDNYYCCIGLVSGSSPMNDGEIITVPALNNKNQKSGTTRKNGPSDATDPDGGAQANDCDDEDDHGNAIITADKKMEKPDDDEKSKKKEATDEGINDSNEHSSLETQENLSAAARQTNNSNDGSNEKEYNNKETMVTSDIIIKTAVPDDENGSDGRNNFVFSCPPDTRIAEFFVTNDGCSFSHRIKDDQPAVYLLEAREHSLGEHFQWLDIGLPDGAPKNFGLTDNHKVIILMGATGSGKSTLINGMINYILGVKWEDPFRFKCVREDESAAQNQAHSQTSSVTAYTIRHHEGMAVPYSITIIDTPGYGDTRGIARDKKITKMIHRFLMEQQETRIEEIHAACFVAASGDSRLTVTQRYILDSVLSIFGKDVQDNIRLLVTFADNAIPPVVEACSAAGFPVTSSDGISYSKFNSSVLYAPNLLQGDDGVDELFWEMGHENFEKFFAMLEGMGGKGLTSTRGVIEQRRQIEQKLKLIESELEKCFVDIEKMEIFRRKIREYGHAMEANKNYEIEITEMHVDKETCRQGLWAYNCYKCQRTCKENISKKFEKRICDTVTCKCKCPKTEHQFDHFKWRMVQIKEKKTLLDVKTEYESNYGKKLSTEELLANFSAELDVAKAKVLSLLDAVEENVRSLESIALRSNALSSADYISLMRSKVAEEQAPGYMTRLETLDELQRMQAAKATLNNNSQ